MKIKIDKDVKLPPPKARGKGRKEIYPFGLLGVGHSFSFSLKQIESVKVRACQMKKTEGKIFYVSSLDLRCWRTK